MSSAANSDHAVELIVRDVSSSDGNEVSGSGEITPLLTHQPHRPRINIFALPYSRAKPREQVIKLSEHETQPIAEAVLWVWNGSRYSGLLCMAISSTVYFLMEVISDIFTAQSVPLFETAFARCTVVSILSFVWLRKSGQPIIRATLPRRLLCLRALVGYLSLWTFIHCIQRLPFSQAIALNFTGPIMTSIMARIILNEKLKISEIGGIACSFFGVLFIFQQMLPTQGFFHKASQESDINSRERNHIYFILVGLFSSITGGISYCLVKAAAKAADQPVVPVFYFGMLASLASGVYMFAFEKLVLPGLRTFFLMLGLGVMSFFAEVLVARGLQLEKTSKVVNMLYMEAALSQLWGMSTSKIAPSFGRLVGCLLILISVCCTMYAGPDKEIE